MESDRAVPFKKEQKNSIYMYLGIDDALASWYNGIAEKYQYMGE